ncbi:hypothetical protein D9757_006237 [Collybiopsis confluens]|uniref:Uncharacterized protein n=1 Tax=Collybiopsis confluens TaxID=2823264 RepID=A0A8H5HK98_9AGAR|nr:hypothetical protein D9757_006237 [Collybiopsis confluens]
MSVAASELELRSRETSGAEEESLDIPASLSDSASVIACDLDDVLCQTNLAVAEWHNEQYGTNMTLDDFYYHYYWKNPYWGGIQETFTKVTELYKTDRLYEAAPIPGAREGVQALRDMGFKLIIVTARVRKFKKGRGHGSKHIFLVCAKLNARLLIDDSSENALQLVTTLSEPIPVLLFGQYEWNKRISSHADSVESMVFENRLQIEGGREFWKEERFEDHIPDGAQIRRVKDWEEVVEWVKTARAENRL